MICRRKMNTKSINYSAFGVKYEEKMINNYNILLLELMLVLQKKFPRENTPQMQRLQQ